MCRHVNHKRLRAVVADGDLLLSPTVARRRGGGIARGGRACGTCSACGGACGIRCAYGASAGGNRRTRCARTRRGARASGGVGSSRSARDGASRSRCRTCARAEGSLAVSLGLVPTVYGLDLVETRPAIYVIHPFGAARVDTVVSSASVHLVAAFAGDDLVVAAVALEAILPAVALETVGPTATLEAVSPARPLRLSSPSVPTSVSSPAVPVKTFASASCPTKSAPAITTITVSKMCSRFIRLPKSTWSLCCLFSLDLINRHWFSVSSPSRLAVPYVTSATIPPSGLGATSEAF